jgi:HD-GYP domain-containing protein (c-di-GMP phosphodiesterase class II)
MTTAKTHTKLDGFIPVAVETLLSAENLDFDLYFPPDGPNAAKLYRERSVPIKTGDFNRLMAQGIDTMYIPAVMARAYREHLKRYVLNDESVPIGNRFRLLKEAARVTFYQALRSGDTGSITSIAQELGEQLAKLLNRNDLLLSDMVTVMLHDYSTYTHITHVSTYSLMLAVKLGIRDGRELVEIAKGGLLHDIGKRFVSIDILEKPGRLDSGEQRLIRDHPRCGFSELCFRPEMSWGALMMVYQHHERCDGTGYPVGFTGDEIHPWARICAIADVFDAMSSDRAYHSGKSVPEVCEYFTRQSGLAFDKEMVQCWNTMIESTLQPT